MNLEDELRTALRSEADAVTRADLALEYPGDPAPRRGWRRFPRAATVLAATAATVALVGGVVWGTGAAGEKVQPAARHTLPPRHPQVHTAKDIPAAVALLPGLYDRMARLADVENTAIEQCMAAKGFTDLPPEFTWADTTRRRDLTPRRAAADGYGLARARAVEEEYRRGWQAWGERNGVQVSEPFMWPTPMYDALLGSEDQALALQISTFAMDVRYGGCLASARGGLWQAAERARFVVDGWPSHAERIAGRAPVYNAGVGAGSLDTLRPDVRAKAPYRAAVQRWDRCMVEAGLAPTIRGLKRDIEGTEYAGLEGELMGGIDLWIADSRDPGYPYDVVLEKRLAAADAACVTSSGYARAAADATRGTDADPAHLMHAQPELIDHVFDLDARARLLLQRYGLEKPR